MSENIAQKGSYGETEALRQRGGWNLWWRWVLATAAIPPEWKIMSPHPGGAVRSDSCASFNPLLRGVRAELLLAHLYRFCRRQQGNGYRFSPCGFTSLPIS